MPEIIDIPPEILRAVTLSWTMEMNHGLATSVFSGQSQAQRGALERWSFTMGIRGMNRRDAQVAQGFFLRLEGQLNLFRMHDPAAALPLGRALGKPVLAANATPGARTLSISGWAANVAGILKAGDWVQIGDQLAKVRVDATSNAAGACSIDIWPKVMKTVAAGQPLIVRQARGLFRFVSDLPSWELDAGRLIRPYEFRITGVQEALSDA